MNSQEETPTPGNPPPRRRSFLRWFLIVVVGGIVLLTVLLVGGIAFGVDWFLKKTITQQLQQSGVAEVEIGSLDFGILRPRIHIRDVKLFSEPRLGGVQVLDLPELFIEYDRSALQKSELRLKQVRIDLKELALVDGVEQKPVTMMQMVQLFPMQMSEYTNRLSSLTNQVDFERAQRVGKLTFKGVERLELTVGKVRFIDLKDPSAERVATLSIHRRKWSNLNSLPELVPIGVDLAVRAAVGAQPVSTQKPAKAASK
jgi:hypothetical protein